MKIRNMPGNRPVDSSPRIKGEGAPAVGSVFHDQRIINEVAFDGIREGSNPPVGNYEYEQMIAESGSAKTNIRKTISEEAYLLAEQRGFSPGGEEADWLQAEINVVRMLRGARG
jgi:hypothetical protein